MKVVKRTCGECLDREHIGNAHDGETAKAQSVKSLNLKNSFPQIAAFAEVTQTNHILWEARCDDRGQTCEMKCKFNRCAMKIQSESSM